MCLKDPVVIHYDAKREMFRLLRGRETFYNERRELIEFETADLAEKWAKENLGVVAKWSSDVAEIRDPDLSGADIDDDPEIGQYKFKF